MGKCLILNPSEWGNLDILEFSMGESTAYITLYNPNYISFFCGMMIPLLLGLLIGCKKIWQKALSGVMLIPTFFCMKASGSDSGWLALTIVFIFVFLVLASRKRITAVIGGTLIVIGLAGALFLLRDHPRWLTLKSNLSGTWSMKELEGLRSVETKMDEVFLFKEDAMSGRGHIWNNTIPLLSKHILMGSGANTYALEYPQNDYVYRIRMGMQRNLDVKAHCWYLQQWVENGLIAMLLLCLFFGWYCVRSIRIYRRADIHQSIFWLGLGIWTSVMTYLVVGLTNDSNVGTAPVFWCLLGLGMAVNRMICDGKK